MFEGGRGLQKLSPIRGRKLALVDAVLETQAGLQKLSPIRGRKLYINVLHYTCEESRFTKAIPD